MIENSVKMVKEPLRSNLMKDQKETALRKSNLRMKNNSKNLYILKNLHQKGAVDLFTALMGHKKRIKNAQSCDYFIVMYRF